MYYFMLKSSIRFSSWNRFPWKRKLKNIQFLHFFIEMHVYDYFQKKYIIRKVQQNLKTMLTVIKSAYQTKSEIRCHGNKLHNFRI